MSKPDALEAFLLNMLRTRLEPFRADLLDVIRRGRRAGLPVDVLRQVVNQTINEVYADTAAAPPAQPVVDVPTPATRREDHRLTRNQACELRDLVWNEKLPSYEAVAAKYGITPKSVIRILTFGAWANCCESHTDLRHEMVTFINRAHPARVPQRRLIADTYGLPETWAEYKDQATE